MVLISRYLGGYVLTNRDKEYVMTNTFDGTDALHAYDLDGHAVPYYPDSNGVMVKGRTYCPGFKLWLVERENGFSFVMEGDDKGAVLTRIFFRTNGSIDEREEQLTITEIGPNPRTKEWEAMWN